MAIKKKSLLTDDTTLPTLNPLSPPAFTNVVALPFAYGYNITANRRVIPVLPDPNATTRPSQNVGFDISITDLTQPRPMYLNDINGILNLYSSAISDFFGGAVPQFSTAYINSQIALGLPTIIQGYRQGAILFNAITSAWVQSLTDYNKVSPTDAPTTWQQITIPNLPVIGNTKLNVPINVPATSVQFANAFVETTLQTPNLATVTPFVTVNGNTPTDDIEPDAAIAVKATSVSFVGATIAANPADANNAIVTVTAPPIPKQRLIFNAVGTGSIQYLVPPTGATGFFLTATAFGGNGGLGGTSGENAIGGGGGGAGAGVNNIYFALPTTPTQYRVEYSAPLTRLIITTPNGLLYLANGLYGASGNSGGVGGTNGQVSGAAMVGIFSTVQTLGSGQTGSTLGGGGGVSSLSNGQEVRAIGGGGGSTGANGYFGGGGGGGGTGSTLGGTGGNAIVIAEWVFP